jgi:hypothetical protein
VFSPKELGQIQRNEGWGKIMLRDVRNLETYRTGWSIIRDYLK